MHLRPSCIGTSLIRNVLVALDAIRSPAWRHAVWTVHPPWTLLIFDNAPPVSMNSRNFAESPNRESHALPDGPCALLTQESVHLQNHSNNSRWGSLFRRAASTVEAGYGAKTRRSQLEQRAAKEASSLGADSV